MSYVEDSMSRGEKLQAVGTVHWAVILEGFPVVLAGFAVGLFVYLEGMIFLVDGMEKEQLFLTIFAAGLTGLGLLGMINGVVYKLTTEFAVTNQRIIFKTGWLSLETHEQRLSKVESIIVDQRILGRSLGFGSIYVHGTGSSSTPIRGVADAQKFRRDILSAVENVDE